MVFYHKMSSMLLPFLLLGWAAVVTGEPEADVNPLAVWINEIHYKDSDGMFDLVELAGPAGYDITGFELEGKNHGAIKLAKKVKNLSNDGKSELGYTCVRISTKLNFLDNDTNNALFLMRPIEGEMSVVQFLSWSNGPVEFAGYVSESIGVDEESSKAGTSMQLTGHGDAYTDFKWVANQPESCGFANEAQTTLAKEEGPEVISPVEAAPKSPTVYKVGSGIVDSCSNSPHTKANRNCSKMFEGGEKNDVNGGDCFVAGEDDKEGAPFKYWAKIHLTHETGVKGVTLLPRSIGLFGFRKKVHKEVEIWVCDSSRGDMSCLFCGETTVAHRGGKAGHRDRDIHCIKDQTLTGDSILLGFNHSGIAICEAGVLTDSE